MTQKRINGLKNRKFITYSCYKSGGEVDQNRKFLKKLLPAPKPKLKTKMAETAISGIIFGTENGR